MTVSTFRKMTARERSLFESLLVNEFPGSAEVRDQLASAEVRTIDANGSLKVSVHSDARAEVDQRVPVEGQYTDADGTHVHLLLHVVRGVLDELEIYKDDSSPICSPPDPEALETWPRPE